MNKVKVSFTLILCLVLIAGCSSEHSGDKAENAASSKIVNNMKEAGPGPLTKENTSLADLHIGDSQDKVIEMFGEPDEKITGGGGTSNIRWLYNKDNLTISFYRSGETVPVGGIVDILISGPSNLKTDKKIGIGSNEQDILKAYPEIAQSEQTEEGIVNYWLNGKELDEGFYHPSLVFVVKEDKVISIELTNSLIDPA